MGITKELADAKAGWGLTRGRGRSNIIGAGIDKAVGKRVVGVVDREARSVSDNSTRLGKWSEAAPYQHPADDPSICHRWKRTRVDAFAKAKMLIATRGVIDLNDLIRGDFQYVISEDLTEINVVTQFYCSGTVFDGDAFLAFF